MAPMSRRAALQVLAGAGLAAVAAACTRSSSRSARPTTTSTTTTTTTGSTSTTTASGTAPACVLTPELTEGPYYIANEAVRRDITEGRPGVPLELDLTVVNAGDCSPIANATVDIWHADATGNYSGFGDASGNRTFLRGVQKTDANGKVTFTTIFPGWYQGRTTHVHVKVFVGGDAVHTGQLFFDETVTAAVNARAPYDSRAGSRVTNAQDAIYRRGGRASTLELSRTGDGYTGSLTMGVRSGGSAASRL